MAKDKKSGSQPIKIENNKDAQTKAPVLNLTIDGSYPDAQVREVAPPTEDAFKTPCSISGVMAGLSGGSLGYAFGFAGYWMRTRLKGTLRGGHIDGWASAKTFALMGGLYAAVGCFMQRLRQKHDAWNGAVSGCATGLALGWNGGPLSALQSCGMLGAFSFFLDGMAGNDAPAYAATYQAGNGNGNDFMSSSGPLSESNNNRLSGTGRRQGRRGNGVACGKSPIELLLSPAMPLLAVLTPCRGVPGGEPGCKVGGWPFRV